MNKAILAGRLTKAPELRNTPGGKAVCEMRVATDRKLGADFHTVIAWGVIAENCAKYLVKGQRVFVLGEIRYRDYTAQDGAKRYVTEIFAEDIEFGDKPRANRIEDELGAPTDTMDELPY